MKMSKISIYFTKREATGSQTAEKNGVANLPNEDEWSNIRYAAARMDLIRFTIGMAAHVTSWFRSSALNKLIGGSSSSKHLRGLAVDFHTKGNNKAIYEQLVEACKTGKISYDQLIFYPSKNFIHVCFCRDITQERKMNFIK